MQCLLNAHLKEKVARSLERPFPEPFSACDNQTLYAVAVYNTVINKPVIGICVTSSHRQSSTFIALKPSRSKTAVTYGEIFRPEVGISRVKAPGCILPTKINIDSSVSNTAVPLDSLGEPPYKVNLLRSYLDD